MYVKPCKPHDVFIFVRNWVLLWSAFFFNFTCVQRPSTEGRWNSSPKGVDFVRHNFEVNCPICGHIYRTNLHIFVAFMCKSHFDYASYDNTWIQDKIFIVQMIADWDLSTYLLRKNSMRWITYNNSNRYDRCLKIPFSWYDYCLTPTRATVELRMIWWTLHDRECNRRNIAWEKIRRKCPELLLMTHCAWLIQNLRGQFRKAERWPSWWFASTFGIIFNFFEMTKNFGYFWKRFRRPVGVYICRTRLHTCKSHLHRQHIVANIYIWT